MAKRISRRAWLEGTAVAVGATFAGGPAWRAAADEAVPEADKIKKTEAQYQQQPKGQQRCEICLQFEAPSKCKIVQGPINPKGWCQYFAARENAH